MVRSGGRGQARELCLEARFLEKFLAASRRMEPIFRARSISRVSSASEGDESRRRSKERSIEREGNSESPRKASRRWSTWLRFWILGFWEGQGRFAIDDGLWRRVSISFSGWWISETDISHRERERGGVSLNQRLMFGRAAECHVYSPRGHVDDKVFDALVSCTPTVN